MTHEIGYKDENGVYYRGGSKSVILHDSMDQMNGFVWLHSNVYTFTSGEIKTFLFRPSGFISPGTRVISWLNLQAKSEDIFTTRYYRDATFTAPGDSLVFQNKILDRTNSPIGQVTISPTVTDQGTLFSTIRNGSKGVPGAQEDGDKWSSLESCLLFTLQNNSNGERDITITLRLSEHADD